MPAMDFDVHGAVRLDKCHAVYHGHIVSLQDTVNNYDNGSVCHAIDLVSGERELFQVKVPDATSIADDPLILMSSGELIYFAGMTLINFYNVAGDPIRGYELSKGDIITVTNLMITGTPAVDSFLEPVAAATKLSVSASLPTTKFKARIIDISEDIYGQAATTFMVLDN